MKHVIKLARKNGSWTVRFTIGVQTFTLDISAPRTKADAKWYKAQLDHALKNLKEVVILTVRSGVESGVKWKSPKGKKKK